MNEQPTDLIYPTLDEFVENYLAVIYGLGPPVGKHWCPSWFEHPPAAVRLDALWHSWEAARRDGTGNWLAAWILFTADPMMAWLQSDQGPFRECSPITGHKPINFQTQLRLKIAKCDPALWQDR